MKTRRGMVKIDRVSGRIRFRQGRFATLHDGLIGLLNLLEPQFRLRPPRVQIRVAAFDQAAVGLFDGRVIRIPVNPQNTEGIVEFVHRFYQGQTGVGFPGDACIGAMNPEMGHQLRILSIFD